MRSTIAAITTVVDKSDGSDTPIHVALRDNSPISGAGRDGRSACHRATQSGSLALEIARSVQEIPRNDSGTAIDRPLPHLVRIAQQPPIPECGHQPLELGERKPLWQELETDGRVANLALETLERPFEDFGMVEGQ